MDWKDPFGREKRRKAAEARAEEHKVRLEAAEERGRQRARDVAREQGVPLRTPEQRVLDEQREARRRVENQAPPPLTDSQMTTNLGVFDSGVVLDGGPERHQHHAPDPDPSPSPSYDPPSDSGSSSYDSGSSDSGSSGGSDF